MLDTRERTALQQLASEELPGLYALARRLGSPDPGDLVQDALVRACRSFPSLHDRQAGCAWLRTILTNVWRDGIRKDGRTPERLTFDDEERVARHAGPDHRSPRPYAETLHVDALGSFSVADIHVVLDRLRSGHPARVMPGSPRGPTLIAADDRGRTGRCDTR